MSRSNPTGSTTNPIPMWIEYKDGTYEYWDRELIKDDGSVGGNVSLGDKIAFLYVAHTFCLSGFNNEKHSFMYSNEVFNTTQPFSLIVMKDKSVIVEGLWKEKKTAFQGAGCKFGINLYALLKVGNEYKRCCIKTHGGAYGAWSEFIAILGGATQEMIDKADKEKKRLPFSFTERGYKKAEQGAVAVVGHVEKKHGKVTFNVPVFKFIDKVTEEANNEAIAFDVELQEYLKGKIGKPPVTTPETEEPQAQAPTSSPAKATATDAELEQTFGEIPARNTGAMQPNQSFNVEEDPSDCPF